MVAGQEAVVSTLCQLPQKGPGPPIRVGLGKEGAIRDQGVRTARRQPRPRVTVGGETQPPTGSLRPWGPRVPFSVPLRRGSWVQSRHLLPGP